MEAEHARKGNAEAEAWLKEPPEPLRCEGCPLLKEQDYRTWIIDMFHKYNRDDLIALMVQKGEESILAGLLKEQEAVEPKQVGLYGNDEWWGLVCVCPDCKAEWMSDKEDTHFCPNCGKKVKWDD